MRNNPTATANNSLNHHQDDGEMKAQFFKYGYINTPKRQIKTGSRSSEASETEF